MKKALIVGGNSGIGLSVALRLLKKGVEHVYIVGKERVNEEDVPDEYKESFAENVSVETINLVNEEYGIFEKIQDIDTLVITVGFGRVAPFEDLTAAEISNLVKCNELSIIRIIKMYYDKIKSENDFFCAVMGSIAGHVASPLFSVYGATKMALCGFIENINAELRAEGYKNCILDVSPGAIKGTKFDGSKNDCTLTEKLAEEIISRMLSRENLYIPDYDEVYKNVIQRYHSDRLKYADESYQYKVRSGRKSSLPQVVIGYLSGTFDLFHIGHLNLLKRAKEQCDYLVVGVHKSGAWKGKETFISFEERMEIVRNIKYVDEVIESFPEDCDAHSVIKYNKLFVGSDYKGTERFLRYEEYFKDKNVEIVYFPYTQGTSSTQLRKALSDRNSHKEGK